MKLAFRTIIFHFVCILIFSIIYYRLSVHGDYIDCISTSTSIQAGVGIASIRPVSFVGKAFMMLQQIILISTHVLTIYIFTV
jgi:hypothetical protein